MDWLTQAAAWLRDWLAQQSWLDGWQSAIALTPDWALLAAGPGLVLLLAMLLLVPRRKRAAEHHAPSTSPSKPQAEVRGARAAAPAATATTSASQPAATTAPDACAQPMRGAAQTEAQASAPVRRASGVPDENEQERKARVFISSTFRDMRTERRVLATDTFPALKRTFRARGVEVQEVDLSWGVNPGDATLDICLAAVRRCNWFVGLIGQRYGATLENAETVALLGDEYPAVRKGLGRSLTEIEILEGVLLNDQDDKRVLFFERDPRWLDSLDPIERPEFEEQSAQAQEKLADLRSSIRARVGAIHGYSSPRDIDAVCEEKMAEALEQAFPPLEGTDDPLMQERRLHAAYARERLGVYVGGEGYLSQLDAWMGEGDAQAKLIVGASGAGKSTLIAHWTTRWVRAHPNDMVFAHYLGASPDSANPAALARRLWLFLNHVTGEDVAVPRPEEKLDDLRNKLSDHIGQASAFAARENCRILLAIDGLDKLAEEYRDLRWWPLALPPRVTLLASSLDGKAREAARERGWAELLVKPFNADEQAKFVAETLKSWNKSDFPEARKQRVLGHKLSGLPLFLKSILEELRVSAANKMLDARLDDYLGAAGVPELFSRILAQIETECGRDFVAQALSLIWAGRAGLEEDEIVGIVAEARSEPEDRSERVGRMSLDWERLRNRLADSLRDQNGRIAFAHDYLERAVVERYLANPNARRDAHLAIADRFEKGPCDGRYAEETPYQLRAAAEADEAGAETIWARLETVLTGKDQLLLLFERGNLELLANWRPLIARNRDPEYLLGKVVLDGLSKDGDIRDDQERLIVGAASFLKFAGADGPIVRRMLHNLVAAAKAREGPNAKKTLLTMTELAVHLRKAGQLSQAEGVLTEGLARLEPGDPSAIGLKEELAEVRMGQGRFGEAVKAYEEILALTTQSFGADAERTMRNANSLAVALEGRGDVAGALVVLERVLAWYRRERGADDLSALQVLHNKASFLAQLNRNGEARAIIGEVLERRTQLLGPNHPDTLKTKTLIALLEGEDGDASGAIESLHAIADAVKWSKGPNDPESLSAAQRLGDALLQSGEAQEARRVFRDVLAGRRRVLGEDHLETRRTMSALALALSAGENWTAATELQERVVELCRKQFGEGGEDTIEALLLLGLIVADSGAWERARDLLAPALKRLEQSPGQDNALTRRARDIVAMNSGAA